MSKRSERIVQQIAAAREKLAKLTVEHDAAMERVALREKEAADLMAQLHLSRVGVMELPKSERVAYRKQHSESQRRIWYERRALHGAAMRMSRQVNWVKQLEERYYLWERYNGPNKPLDQKED